jgi:hypothetical protein
MPTILSRAENDLPYIRQPKRLKHLADSSDAFGDVSFSYAVTSAGLSLSSILIKS